MHSHYSTYSCATGILQALCSAKSAMAAVRALSMATATRMLFGQIRLLQTHSVMPMTLQGAVFTRLLLATDLPTPFRCACFIYYTVLASLRLSGFYMPFYLLCSPVKRLFFKQSLVPPYCFLFYILLLCLKKMYTLHPLELLSTLSPPAYYSCATGILQALCSATPTMAAVRAHLWVQAGLTTATRITFGQAVRSLAEYIGFQT